MKHVWILNHYAQEPTRAGGTRHYCLARELAGCGWQATVVAASVDHYSGEQRLEPGERVRVEEIEGVRFCWLRTHRYSGNGASRIRNMLDYTFGALKPGLARRLGVPDAVIGSSVHPLAAWAGMKLGRRHKVPFLFEVRDLWPQTLVDMGRLEDGAMLTRVLRRLERHLFQEAQSIITLLPRAVEYIAPMGIPEAKVVWIPNGVDLDLYPRPEPPEEHPGLTLLYTGAHGQANGLDTLLSAMSIVEDKDRDRRIRLRMVGDGPQKRMLESRAADLGLRSVCFEGPVPKSEMPRVTAAADAFVLCVRDLPGLYRYGISMNKIFDYMAAGRPTVISTSAVNNPIADAQAGLSVPAEDPEALAGAILKMEALPAGTRRAMGEAARNHVEQNYSFHMLAKRLAATLDSTRSATV